MQLPSDISWYHKLHLDMHLYIKKQNDRAEAVNLSSEDKTVAGNKRLNIKAGTETRTKTAAQMRDAHGKRISL